MDQTRTSSMRLSHQVLSTPVQRVRRRKQALAGSQITLECEPAAWRALLQYLAKCGVIRFPGLCRMAPDAS